MKIFFNRRQIPETGDYMQIHFTNHKYSSNVDRKWYSSLCNNFESEQEKGQTNVNHWITQY